MADNDIGRIGMSPYFPSMNANKRSITLDMKHPRAAEVLVRLAAGADVVVQNFRPGVLTRLGFGYEAVRKNKPDIIYCSISGYGQEGPFAAAPAYDGAVQAVSGLMSVTGRPNGPPTRVGTSIVDLSTAMMAAFAIASALFRRAVTGEGQHLDVAMFDTALALMAPMASVWLNTGRPPERLGNGSPAYVPTADSFPVADGEILIAAHLRRHRSRGPAGRSALRHNPGPPRQRRRLARAADRGVRNRRCRRMGEALVRRRRAGRTGPDVTGRAEAPATRLPQHCFAAARRGGY
jgi:crotonobetainyl-CoA:carnitine CoA-transferase CaiB-like acyl-CoA transferase